MADFVAKVLLHSSSKFILAVRAIRCGGPHGLTINSLTTSVMRLRAHESAIVGRSFLQQENSRQAIWDFCNNIGTQRR
jgi:hypothetical protein